MTCPEPAASAAAELAALPEPLRRHLRDQVLPLAGWRPGAEGGPPPRLAGRRVGFFRKNLLRGGSARVMIEQLAALDAAGAATDVYYFEDAVDPDVLAALRARAPGVGRIRFVSRRLASWRTLALELIPRRHDLFLSTDIPDPFIYAGTAARFGLPRRPRLAIVMHEAYDRYVEYFRPFADRMAAACLDYDFMDRFRALYGPAIPAGIVAPFFPLEPAAPAPGGREAFGLPPGAQVLACAGRLDRNKRIAFLGDVLEDLLAEGRDAWLLLAGRWETEAYRKEVLAAWDRPAAVPGGRIRLADRVRVAGPLPSLAPVHAAADVFVFASAIEGFYPLAVMEAQQAGLPVVCTAVGGLDRLILDGVTGFLAPVEARSDCAALRPETRRVFGERVGALLDDPARARAMGEAGRAVTGFLCRRYPFAPLFLKWISSVLEPGRAP